MRNGVVVVVFRRRRWWWRWGPVEACRRTDITSQAPERWAFRPRRPRFAINTTSSMRILQQTHSQLLHPIHKVPTLLLVLTRSLRRRPNSYTKAHIFNTKLTLGGRMIWIWCCLNWRIGKEWGWGWNLKVGIFQNFLFWERMYKIMT